MASSKTLTMEEAVRAFPGYLEQARELGRGFSHPRVEADKVVVLGMGGSAIGGDLLKALAEKISTIPVLVIRNDEIPNYVDDKTLVLVVSYSGNTRETLLSLKAALYKSQGKVIAISTGGALKDEALKQVFPHLEIPGGLMPRAALPFTFVPLIFILMKMFSLPDQTLALEEAIAVLKRMRESVPEAAAELARGLCGKFPVIYASNPSFAAAARRWKCQINENAKQPACFGVFPELVHNEIVGFTRPLPIHRLMSVVILRNADESDASVKRIDFVKRMASRAGTEVREVFAAGDSFLARLLSLCYYGDFVSLYLAQENGVDPAPIDVIDELKRELR